MTDGPYRLPSGWRWVRLGEVASVKYGKAKPKGNGHVPVVGSGGAYSTTSKPLIENPTIVIGRKGSAGSVALLEQPCWPSDTTFFLEWSTVDPYPRFVFYALLNSPFSTNRAKTTLPTLQRPDIEDYLIPFPPPADQCRIMARVEVLLERVHEAKHLREGSRKDADTLFPSALEHVLADVYANSPQILPLGDFATAFNGRASGSGESEVRVLKTKHVYPFDLKQTDPSYMRPDQVTKCPSDRFLRSGDVLVCNIARGTLGRVCHVDSAEDNWTVDTQIMILRTEARSLGKWLFYYLHSRRGQAEILAREKGIAFADKRGQTHLYPRDMMTVPVPLPLIEDQRCIVACLDSIQVQAATLKRAQQDTDAELRRLEQAILHRAFRGEL